MNDQSLTHEQKVEKLLSLSVLLQAQILNLACLEADKPPLEMKQELGEIVRDSQTSVVEIMNS